MFSYNRRNKTEFFYSTVKYWIRQTLLSSKSPFLVVIKNSSLLHDLKYVSRKKGFENGCVSEKLFTDLLLNIH